MESRRLSEKMEFWSQMFDVSRLAQFKSFWTKQILKLKQLLLTGNTYFQDKQESNGHSFYGLLR